MRRNGDVASETWELEAPRIGRPSEKVLYTPCRDLSEHFRRICLVIDGLDEYDEDTGGGPTLFGILRSFCAGHPMSILLCSRPVSHIQRLLEAEGCQEIRVDEFTSTEDIRHYVEDKLYKAGANMARSECDREGLLERIAAISQGKYGSIPPSLSMETVTDQLLAF